jgi:hypothetical protein
VRFGDAPVLILAIVALLAGWWLAMRPGPAPAERRPAGGLYS